MNIGLCDNTDLNTSLNNLIDGFVEQTRKILQDNLVGIYLHGSSAMGCFNPNKSDLDFLIVVNQPMSDATKKAYMDMVVEYNALGPAKGIEMSIVKKDVCNPFVYPTPYELHFSVRHLAWYKENPDDYVHRMNGTDKDLAAHFTMITNNRSKCLYGAPVAEVFAEVPKNDYMDSIWFDIENAPEEISNHTMYLTLNLARVWAYQKDGLILSKKEGGEWAIKNMPAEYHSLINDALKEYLESAKVVYDEALAVRYAEYVIRHLKK